MAVEASGDIIGMQDLMEKLSGIGSLVTQGRLLGQALREGSKIIAEEAERLAPHDTGKLAASIVVSITNRTATEAIAKIGPDREASYGTPEEYGSIHNAAQPFMRPAFDAHVDEATAVIGYTLARGIERAAKKEAAE